MQSITQRLICALIALLSPAAQANGAAGERAGEAVLAASGSAVTLVDLLPFLIAAAGITGLLLIRRQTHYL
jgi:hypothetical protein